MKLIVNPVRQIDAVRCYTLPDLKEITLSLRRDVKKRCPLTRPVTQPGCFTLLHIRSGLLIGQELAALELFERSLNLRGNGVPLLEQPAILGAKHLQSTRDDIVRVLVAAVLHGLRYKLLLFRTEPDRQLFSRYNQVLA